MIGYGQYSESEIFLSERKLTGIYGSQTDIYIGKNSDLKGKELVVRTRVHDIQKRTSHTSVLFKLRGGDGELFEDLSCQAQQDDDIVQYNLKVKFL